jgi:uncharacterized protein (DUF58 family)
VAKADLRADPVVGTLANNKRSALGLQEKSRPSVGSEALDQAEAALKKLRRQPEDKQAAEALEKALQRLKDRRPKTEPQQPQGTTGAPKGK